ncbi:hypothetical protein A2U01_0021577, partial [Trifolium medium]|nr:hypothetical protein [Trifolium medium]
IPRLRIRLRTSLLVRRCCSIPFWIMAARTNAQIAEALATVANIMARDNQPGREDEMRLEWFMKHKPPTFTGGCNPEGAVNWIKEVEIIFEAMGCSKESKTTLGTYVL